MSTGWVLFIKNVLGNTQTIFMIRPRIGSFRHGSIVNTDTNVMGRDLNNAFVWVLCCVFMII